MIYDVRQTTTCSYASPVAHARHVLRLTPVSRDGERVHVAALQIVPEPAHRREGQDFFGNRLTWIEINEPHQTLTVKLSARVAVDAEAVPLETLTWEDVREAAFATSDLGPLSPAHFLFPSSYRLARPGNPRLCPAKLSAGTRCGGGGYRADRPHEGRHRL